ncbi:MAG: ATP synthase F1 subunit gamma [Bacteroidales bacterium]|nr:ATP synthase F1 subunit gamma [Bacteroidales bacterium]
MANLQEVRNRITSVSSTRQITSAMKMVSAAKFRRAQASIIGMRPYSAELNSILSSIEVGDGMETLYHRTSKLQRVLLVVMTSNKGLCGAFNSNVIKSALARVEEYKGKGVEVSVITLGKRGTDVFQKQTGLLVESYDALLDHPLFDEVAKVAEDIMTDFSKGKYDRVELIYNRFKNSLVQILTNEQFLPVAPSAQDATKQGKQGGILNDYIYEPGKEQILADIIPLSLRTQFYRTVLDTLASEHGARMNAMQKATDNATEMLKDLRLSYNKARQAAITNEIIEIVSGAEALNG